MKEELVKKIKNDVIKQLQDDIKDSVVESIYDSESEEQLKDLKEEILKGVKEELFGELEGAIKDLDGNPLEFLKYRGYKFDVDKMGALANGVQSLRARLSDIPGVEKIENPTHEDLHGPAKFLSGKKTSQDLYEEAVKKNPSLLDENQNTFMDAMESIERGEKKPNVKKPADIKTWVSKHKKTSNSSFNSSFPSFMETMSDITERINPEKEKETMLKETSIEEVIDDKKIIKLLRNNNIENLAQLIETEDFSVLKGIGPKSVEKIKEYIKNNKYTKENKHGIL